MNKSGLVEIKDSELEILSRNSFNEISRNQMLVTKYTIGIRSWYDEMWSIPCYGLPQTLPHGSWTYSKHTPRLTSVPSAFASLVASVRNPTSKGPVQSKNKYFF